MRFVFNFIFLSVLISLWEIGLKILSGSFSCFAQLTHNFHDYDCRISTSNSLMSDLLVSKSHSPWPTAVIIEMKILLVAKK